MKLLSLQDLSLAGSQPMVDDEGNIYENDTDDFREMKEPTTDMRGFEGAMTEKGMKRQKKY